MHTLRLKVLKPKVEPNVRQEFARVVAESKSEVFETDNVESKWEMHVRRQQKKYVDEQNDHREIFRLGNGMNEEVPEAIEEKNCTIRYCIKPKQQVIGISIRRQNVIQGNTPGNNVYQVATQIAKSW